MNKKTIIIILLLQYKSAFQRLNKNTNPIIKCTVDVDGNRIQQNFESTTSIGEVKRSLKRKYQEMGHKTKKLDKEIVFYCDGKPITDESEQIGNIAEGADVNFEILSVSLNDSSIKDDFKIQEKLIDKLAGKCQYHQYFQHGSLRTAYQNSRLFQCKGCYFQFYRMVSQLLCKERNPCKCPGAGIFPDHAEPCASL